jgi:hypothetical protein
MAEFAFDSENGVIRGNKELVSGSTYCVVLACGHNGFYHFAFFPTIQKVLAEKGVSMVIISMISRHMRKTVDV